MQLKWGTYAFVANACEIKAYFETLKNRGGQPYASRQRLDVAGFLQTSGQADCTAQMNALASALAAPYKDLIFYDDTGAQTATKLLNATSISGVIITRGPEFLGNTGGEYSNYRRFSFTAEAEYPLSGSQNLLLSFTEHLVFKGGGPKNVILLAVSGPHQPQTPYLSTPFYVTQQGEAVGYRGYPTAPPSLWPFALLETPDIEAVSPDRMPRGYQGYKTVWKYSHGSIRALTGTPHLWVG